MAKADNIWDLQLMVAAPPVDSSSRLMLRPERRRESERAEEVDFIVVDSFVIPS